ncbi:hypothetical protein [Yinghuangia seranimata]|uniref:hypothetical protein n=1 Tax=Yinghuangia seranimata TaxID=408067 RepID=UPI00248CE4F0|nr:hypothetical protein [Yinghuangia seranimata]MDI2129451.1 hypothetical protein [Yinghuangia seranimata]
MRIRTFAAAAALAAAVLLGGAGQAGAHGDTIVFTITELGDGHTRVAATWANDHDPVTEKVAGTLSATADDGRTVGPWKLEPVAGTPGTFTTRLALPPGHWAVVVESGFPALGRGQADLTVTAVPGTEPSPSTVIDPVAPSTAPSTPGPASPAPPAQTPIAAPPSSSSSDSGPSRLIIGTVLVAIVLVAAELLRRRRAAR